MDSNALARLKAHCLKPVAKGWSEIANVSGQIDPN
jgi:hypothetical protein